ncbi:3-oxo-5-alpha-steroid 4-dehydrogenase 1-like [Watersipora subatra]|uniref:3-oxo-5-alpha-steroid 4-dehydrogenase 1-like n=1 Tax=Watersipora subatra TaxID=2589382 RepID=UPI00355AF2BF
MFRLLEKEFFEQIHFISTTLLALSFAIIFVLLWIPAPYGRYYDTKVLNLHFKPINGRLSWVLMEAPNLIVPLFLIAIPSSDIVMLPANFILFGMFTCHYIHRTLIYPFLQPVKPHTAITVLSAFAFCSINAYIQGLSLFVVHKYPNSWIQQPSFIAGVAVWLLGLYINIRGDHVLRNLRKPGEIGYKIPNGFWYDYVSCANFLGEVIEWFGYALACWNIAALSFAVFTAANLIPRAIQHHKFYKEKFEDYPKTRKAIIPFIL